MTAKFLAIVLMFNGVFVLEESTRLNDLPPVRVSFDIPGPAINRMISGQLQPDLGCTLEARNNGRPKRNVKMVLEGSFFNGSDVRLPILRQVERTNKNGIAKYDLTFSTIQYLALLLLDSGPRGTQVDLTGFFKGAKRVDDYSISCGLEGLTKD